jgi:hypothetical protein
MTSAATGELISSTIYYYPGGGGSGWGVSHSFGGGGFGTGGSGERGGGGRRGAPTGRANLIADRYSVVINRMPTGVTPQQFLMSLASDMDAAVADPLFSMVNDFTRRSDGPVKVGDIIDIDILGPDDGSIEIIEITSMTFTIMAITTEETGSHPEVGTRTWGFRPVDGGIEFYTEGLSRPRDPFTGLVSPFFQKVSWARLMRGISDSVDRAGGESRPGSFSYQNESDWW